MLSVSMTDVFTKEKRSQVMSRIRGRGNKNTEIALARRLRSNNIKGWRRHQTLAGRPDFVFRKQRVAIFVDGCFWHSCPKHNTKPKNNETFWTLKLAGNKARDLAVNRLLRNNGWTVLRIWEHELSAKKKMAVLRKIQRKLNLL